MGKDKPAKKNKLPAAKTSPKLGPQASATLGHKVSPTLKEKPSPKLGPNKSPKLAPEACPQTSKKSRFAKLPPASTADDLVRKKQKRLLELESVDQPPTKASKSSPDVGSPDGREAMGVCDVSDVLDISEPSRKVLAGRGISRLFEIQQKAFSPCFSGHDVVARAKTGCGKTLAFVLPVVERIRAENLVVKSAFGRRNPLCVTIAPTRELAKQIFSDFESIGGAAGFVAKCFYGGTAFGPQCDDIRKGIDILVCTPGRLLDHIRRSTVDLSNCRILVLDEADEMLSMGFKEDIEEIMESMSSGRVQKLLFSATLPKWVNAIVSKHLSSPIHIDVAQDPNGNTTNSLITHHCVLCPPSMRGDCIGDLCKVHAGAYGKTLVFVSTKKDCDELAANDKLAAIGAGVLHGDIPQASRETVMEGFRSGRIRCLVATDVAARGIDVPAVDLVVQTRPPQDLDSYVHRAGRTGRAGRSGTSVCFYSSNEEYLIRLIEHKKGIKMKRVGPPQPKDVVGAAAEDAVRQLDHVHQASVEAFLEKAKELIAERGAEVVLAASLAALTGHTRELRGRSLLSSYEGMTAMILESDRGIETGGKGFYLLRQMLPWELSESCRGCTRCLDEKRCIFDVPDDKVSKILEVELWKGTKICVAAELPDLQEKVTDIWEAQQKHKVNKQWLWDKRKGGGKGKSHDRDGNGDRNEKDWEEKASGKGKSKGKGMSKAVSKGSGRGSSSGRGRGGGVEDAGGSRGGGRAWGGRGSGRG